jgi:hypothetical protein
MYFCRVNPKKMNFVAKFLLPVAACVLAVTAVCYSACHESKADSVKQSTATLAKQDLRTYEAQIQAFGTLHEQEVKLYTEQVGMTSDSKALAVIQAHKTMLDKHNSRLEYHRLKFLHGDTLDGSKTQTLHTALLADLEQIRSDLDSMKNTEGSNLNIRK